MRSSLVEWGGLNETIMEAEPLLSLPMGSVRTMGDNRVGWIPNCEDAAPPRCAPTCKATCCAFCAFCAFRYFISARASGGTCSACYAFCVCSLVCTCCTRCARSMRFQNLTCNTMGHKSRPPARSVQMVDKGVFLWLWLSGPSRVPRVPRGEMLALGVLGVAESMLGFFLCGFGVFRVRATVGTWLSRYVCRRCPPFPTMVPCARRACRARHARLYHLGSQVVPRDGCLSGAFSVFCRVFF